MPVGPLSPINSSVTRIAPGFYFPLMMSLIGLDKVDPRIPVLVMTVFYRNLRRLEQRTQTIMPCC